VTDHLPSAWVFSGTSMRPSALPSFVDTGIAFLHAAILLRDSYDLSWDMPHLSTLFPRCSMLSRSMDWSLQIRSKSMPASKASGPIR
jgi:hypothetical protein